MNLLGASDLVALKLEYSSGMLILRKLHFFVMLDFFLFGLRINESARTPVMHHTAYRFDQATQSGDEIVHRKVVMG